MVKRVVANISQPVFYCADCDHEFEKSLQGRVGQRFICPVDSDHLAAIVKPPAGKLWLRIELRISQLAEYSPMRVVGGGGRAGVYHLLRMGGLVILLLFARGNLSGIYNVMLAGLTIYWLYDILLISTYATFVSRFPTHPLRTIVLTISSLFQIGLIYAVFYRLDAKGFGRELNGVDAVYFSIVTISTVGYGDIAPITNAYATKLLILSELLIGSYVLTTLFSVVAGWANDRPTGNTVLTMQDLGSLYRPEPPIGARERGDPKE